MSFYSYNIYIDNNNFTLVIMCNEQEHYRGVYSKDAMTDAEISDFCKNKAEIITATPLLMPFVGVLDAAN